MSWFSPKDIECAIFRVNGCGVEQAEACTLSKGELVAAEEVGTLVRRTKGFDTAGSHINESILAKKTPGGELIPTPGVVFRKKALALAKRNVP